MARPPSSQPAWWRGRCLLRDHEGHLVVAPHSTSTILTSLPHADRLYLTGTDTDIKPSSLATTISGIGCGGSCPTPPAHASERRRSPWWLAAFVCTLQRGVHFFHFFDSISRGSSEIAAARKQLVVPKIPTLFLSSPFHRVHTPESTPSALAGGYRRDRSLPVLESISWRRDSLQA